MSLTEDAVYFRGQPAIARGWFGRARELLEGQELIPEHGWLHIVEGDLALIVEGDMIGAGECARRAAGVARSLGLTDLALVARALEATSLVGAGRIVEGMPRLDEVATAALHGEIADPMAIGICCCYLMIACERARDLDRAAQWSAEIRRFCERWRFNSVLALCRAQHAGLLVERGLWADAERELELAIAQLATSRPALRGEGIVRLAILRRKQGRFDEAARLVEEVAGHPLAVLERASLAFDRDEPADAIRCAELFLRHVKGEGHPDRMVALELLVRARLAAGQISAATETLGELEAVAGTEPTGPWRATVTSARGRIALVRGEHDRAVRAFEEAIEDLTQAGAPFDAARIRIELAEALRAMGQLEAAVRQATSSEKALRALGARAAAERAARVVRECDTPSASQARPDGLTAREVSVLRQLAQGRSNHEIASALFVSEFTIKRHVANILNKLDLPSRAAAAAYAARKGLG